MSALVVVDAVLEECSLDLEHGRWPGRSVEELVEVVRGVDGGTRSGCGRAFTRRGCGRMSEWCRTWSFYDALLDSELNELVGEM